LTSQAHKDIRGRPHSCWIGLNDEYQEGGFEWHDGTAVGCSAIRLACPFELGRTFARAHSSPSGAPEPPPLRRLAALRRWST
jgi:hypothetical protein